MREPPKDEEVAAFGKELEEFLVGKPGTVRPSSHVMAEARRLVQAAGRLKYVPVIAVDDDGALALEARLSQTEQLFAELQPDGRLLAHVYDESVGKLHFLGIIDSANLADYVSQRA